MANKGNLFRNAVTDYIRSWDEPLEVLQEVHRRNSPARRTCAGFIKIYLLREQSNAKTKPEALYDLHSLFF